ncbi:FAD-dependent monooxygenase [Nocardia vermiculata]|uniref:NAD(P)-binding protein n=1 Tax=Nocardia vermiculata TaxID=257274 RepID=A0A846Y4J1_9NOCA|nr:FAD-dependent monooxygenase [Nocardia vermiculata]NKY52872.1 NAD(P)-binding protein [Nocardia vermiculata]
MRVIVVGAGIGGLAAGIALQRRGHDVQVWERAGGPADAGSGLTLWPNGLRALDALGLGDPVRARAMIDTAGGIRDRSGRWLSRTDTAAFAARHGSVVAVHRTDLLDILRSALEPERLHYGRAVTGVATAGARDDAAPGSRTGSAGTAHSGTGSRAAATARPGVGRVEDLVPATAADAAATVRVHHDSGWDTADLVVGADGVRSVVRAAVRPGARPPRYAGYTAWRMVTPPTTPLREGGEFFGSGERFGVVPLPDGRVYLFGVADAPAGQHAVDGEFAELRRRFGGWPEPIPRLLELVSPDEVLRHDIYDLPPLGSLVRGPVAVLGDAAHAMTPNLGQGANQALEDAVTLAAVLADRPLEAALRTYDTLRRPRTRTLTLRSRLIGSVAQWSWRPAVTVRDTTLRCMPDRAMLQAFDSAVDWYPPA